MSRDYFEVSEKVEVLRCPPFQKGFDELRDR